jgi:hypothetical protein
MGRWLRIELVGLWEDCANHTQPVVTEEGIPFTVFRIAKEE